MNTNTQILKKDDVVRRLSNDTLEQIEDVVDKVNDILDSCSEIPLAVPKETLGKNSTVRNEVIRRCVAAGWQVKATETEYIIS